MGRYLVTIWLVYGLAAVGLTCLLARVLHRHGAVFLGAVFSGNGDLARAVNGLLVVGFYMLNLGYALYIVRASKGLDAFAGVQFLVNRLAILLVTLAALHFVNVFAFWRIRSHREQRQLPPPVMPQVLVPPATPQAPR
jgi:hypothetical protein